MEKSNSAFNFQQNNFARAKYEYGDRYRQKQNFDAGTNLGK